VLQHVEGFLDDGLLRSSEAAVMLQPSETMSPPTVACPPPRQQNEQGIERQTVTAAQPEARHHGRQETASADWARQVSEVSET